MRDSEVPFDEVLASAQSDDSGPWARLDGEDVCPSCQTPEERRDVARRIVAAIEAAIARMAENGDEPTVPESGLIAYAMRLRDRLEVTDETVGGQSRPERSPAHTPDPDRRQLRVAMTAAFLTGHSLRIRIGEYDDVQTRLAGHFDGMGKQGWSIPSDHRLASGTYNSGGGFSSMLPLVIARRDGPDALTCTRTLLQDRPDNERSWLAEHADGWSMTPTSMRIDIYDLGMAVMNGTFSMSAPAEMSLHAVVRSVKQFVWLRTDPSAGILSPIASAFRSLAAETTEQFDVAIKAAAPHTIRRPWLAPFLDAAGASEDERGSFAEWGRLLWLHPVHLLEVEDSSEVEWNAREVAPPFHRAIDVPDGRFVSGIGWSAVVTGKAPTDTDVTMRLVELHWAYIALYMEIDRGLLALLNDARWERAISLAEMEADADRVFADYMRVMEARARVDSTLASLGGDEQTIWDTISDVTRFDALVAGVDRKVDTLKQIAERRVQQAAAAQARRTSAILSGLTALTVITVTVAVTTNFLGGRSDPVGHIELRVLFVASAVLASIGWYRAAHRERAQVRIEVAGGTSAIARLLRRMSRGR